MLSGRAPMAREAGEGVKAEGGAQDEWVAAEGGGRGSRRQHGDGWLCQAGAGRAVETLPHRMCVCRTCVRCGEGLLMSPRWVPRRQDRETIKHQSTDTDGLLPPN